MLPFAISHKNNIQGKNNPGTMHRQDRKWAALLAVFVVVVVAVVATIHSAEDIRHRKAKKTTATTTTTKATTNGQIQMHSVLHSLYMYMFL